MYRINWQQLDDIMYANTEKHPLTPTSISWTQSSCDTKYMRAHFERELLQRRRIQTRIARSLSRGKYTGWSVEESIQVPQFKKWTKLSFASFWLCQLIKYCLPISCRYFCWEYILESSKLFTYSWIQSALQRTKRSPFSEPDWNWHVLLPDFLC